MPTNVALWEDINGKDGFTKSIVLQGTSAQTAGNYGHFWTARFPCEVSWVSAVMAVPGSNAVGETLDLLKASSGTAISAGVSVLAAAFDLRSVAGGGTAVANTPVFKLGTDLSAVSGARQLNTGDRIGLNTSGILTALEQVEVTVYFKYLGHGNYR